MPIALPDLDDRGYAELLEEARALLPALAPEWTNQNPSDPGITLVELFAWLAEMVAWRANQVPDDNVRAFLGLLNGPGGEEGKELGEAVRAAVSTLRDGYRAVTAADYERLATLAFNDALDLARKAEAAQGSPLEWYGVSGLADPLGRWRVQPVARARCVPRRQLDAGSEAERARDRPGRVSVLVLPGREDDPWEELHSPPRSGDGPPRAGEDTLRAVWAFLEERRLLATRVHVASPVYVPVRVEAAVVRRPDAPEPAAPEALWPGWDRVPQGDVRRGVLEAVAAWLDPLLGGPDRRGWPFGHDVHLSDLYGVIERVPGVDFVADLRLSSVCAPGDAGCVAAADALHPQTGEQVGLALAAHHLPRAELAPEDVHVAAAAVPVRVRVSLLPAEGVSREALETAVGGAVRRVFSPFGGGPNGSAHTEVTAGDVAAAVRALAEADPVHAVDVRLEADPLRLRSAGLAQAMRFEAGEVAAPGVELDATGRALWS
jgi:hypothetical protein